tara:strand:+ start:14454 stop:14738 length:285 start_codon:yes stop_codon:yes gene_type:complete
VNAAARVLEERETPNGWSFRLSLERPGTEPTEHEMTLSWVDHDHWTGGGTPPSRLAERILSILAARVDALPARFDAARARRWVPEIDDVLMGMG